MRIDVKNVKGKKYLQFVDEKGHIYHIGSATDFESWLVSLVLWNQNWLAECYKKREEFFIKIESEMNRYVQLNAEKILAINAIESHRGTLLRIPETIPFGWLELNENVEQLPLQSRIWRWNEWAIRSQNRLDEIHSMQSKQARKYEKLNLLTEKEKRLMMLKDQNIKAHIHAWEQMSRRIGEEQHVILVVLKEMEKEKGVAKKTAVVKELITRNKIPRAETERVLAQLLREGKIYERWKGYLKTT